MGVGGVVGAQLTISRRGPGDLGLVADEQGALRRSSGRLLRAGDGCRYGLPWFLYRRLPGLRRSSSGATAWWRVAVIRRRRPFAGSGVSRSCVKPSVQYGAGPAASGVGVRVRLASLALRSRARRRRILPLRLLASAARRGSLGGLVRTHDRLAFGVELEFGDQPRARPRRGDVGARSPATVCSGGPALHLSLVTAGQNFTYYQDSLLCEAGFLAISSPCGARFTLSARSGTQSVFRWLCCGCSGGWCSSRRT